jgi:hypothetical protein
LIPKDRGYTKRFENKLFEEETFLFTVLPGRDDEDIEKFRQIFSEGFFIDFH